MSAGVRGQAAGTRYGCMSLYPVPYALQISLHGAPADGERGGRGSRLAPPGELQEVLAGTPIGLPNGMAWDTEQRAMYFVDSKAQTITAYPTDEGGVPLEGQPGRLVVTVPAEDGVPDGMTIDRCELLCVSARPVLPGRGTEAAASSSLPHQAVLAVT